jgi:hypothetical protein
MSVSKRLGNRSRTEKNRGLDNLIPKNCGIENLSGLDNLIPENCGIENLKRTERETRSGAGAGAETKSRQT